MASKLKAEKPRRIDGSFFYPPNGLIGLLNSPPSIIISSAVTSYFHLLFDFDADLRVYSASEALKAELRTALYILCPCQKIYEGYLEEKYARSTPSTPCSGTTQDTKVEWNHRGACERRRKKIQKE
ncbi:hypothetical protein L1987_75602 [Smallanthus sonchifolius]|uniref:Uncharacterized protein n=1 Tax=Smallanthus sonchifolius TaxID=185202 RepID=A0ACB9A5X2_9ASTR|nr:hypothetical protein L1987_75602 [Smallanthus sonchifolius]